MYKYRYAIGLVDSHTCIIMYIIALIYIYISIEGSLVVKLPTIWTDEKQSREEED